MCNQLLSFSRPGQIIQRYSRPQINSVVLVGLKTMGAMPHHLKNLGVKASPIAPMLPPPMISSVWRLLLQSRAQTTPLKRTWQLQFPFTEFADHYIQVQLFLLVCEYAYYNARTYDIAAEQQIKGVTNHWTTNHWTGLDWPGVLIFVLCSDVCS